MGAVLAVQPRGRRPGRAAGLAAQPGRPYVRGLISSAWQLEGAQFRFQIQIQIQIPPNVVASVRIPSADGFGVQDAAGRGPAGIAADASVSLRARRPVSRPSIAVI